MSLLYRHSPEGSLHQCGASEIESKLYKEPITLLILAAKEFQPESRFRQVDKILVPLIDSSSLSPRALNKTIDAADEIANYAVKRIKQGCHVLSTCWAGWNRSGLISGLILAKLTDVPGKDIVKHIRSNRSIFALSNPLFAKHIKQL